jgi:protein-disulfide isomerase
MEAIDSKSTIAGMDPYHLAVPVSPVDHLLGPEHAPVTLVEYGDFECPNCRQAAPAVKQLVGRFAGKVRLAWRHFPLEDVHPHALHAALAAEAAGAQGKFWQMHDLLLAHQDHLKDKQLHGYADQLELDIARFDEDLKEARYLQRVREHIDGARKSGARGTPTFFLNGGIIDASFGLQRLHDAVERLAR